MLCFLDCSLNYMIDSADNSRRIINGAMIHPNYLVVYLSETYVSLGSTQRHELISDSPTSQSSAYIERTSLPQRLGNGISEP